jgi:hypothetical protein
MTTVFTSAQCDELEQVLETAWEIYLRKGATRITSTPRARR